MDPQHTVSDKIASAFADLPRGQRQVARFIIDNEYFVAFASAAEVAEEAGVSAATVVRLCQALGYEGYPHLRASIRRKFHRFIPTTQRLEDRLTAPIPKDDVLTRAFATSIDNVKHTMGLIDREMFEGAIDAIGHASDILVVGGGLSAAPALFLSHSLKVMGFHVRVVTTGGIPLSLENSTLQSDDLLICIGYWRYFREIVTTMRRAQETGTASIAITDSEVSPLAQMADYAFVTTTESIGHSVSPLASIALIEAMIAALCFERPQETLAALQHVDAAYKETAQLLQE
ncbi:MAG: MurR/RpiR family transcriptional regulator [Anaerolineae bacterium]|jgi:DNA-binding MurR/RpiR family transcriptional regulator